MPAHPFIEENIADARCFYLQIQQTRQLSCCFYLFTIADIIHRFSVKHAAVADAACLRHENMSSIWELMFQ
jgi:hypothetical protein